MPTGGPGYPSLSKPKTRILQNWGNYWRFVSVKRPARLQHARDVSTMTRRLAARR